MIYKKLSLKDRVIQNYRKYVLLSRIDYIFHILFSFSVTYIVLIIVFFVESVINFFEESPDISIKWFYLGLGLGLGFITYLLHRLFHWLDDVDETHNQFALGTGVFLAILLFAFIQALDLSWSHTAHLVLDLCILAASLGFNFGFFSRFWKKVFRIKK
jgi:H+/Cl- antiporter ClcA